MNSVWRMVILVLVGLTMPALAQLTDEIKEISFKEVDYNYSEKTFIYEGHKVAYIDTGVGKPVIFLHGQASDITNFETVYPVVEKEFRVLSVDYPGSGNQINRRLSSLKSLSLG